MSDNEKNSFVESVGGLLILLIVWQGFGWYNDWSFTPFGIVKSFIYEPTPEELAAKEARQAEKDRLKQEKKQKQAEDFISDLETNNFSSDIINFNNLARIHNTETELQNEETEKKLKGKYIKISGELTEVDSSGGKYGINKYLVQIYQPYLFATAKCYATTKDIENYLKNLKLGSSVTLSGRVTNYGDIIGLQIDDCVVYK